MYTPEQIDRARRTDLYQFLPDYDPSGWKRADARRIKSTKHDSLLVTRGKGYCWNSRGLSGLNAIDFMETYYGLSFTDSVRTLINETADDAAGRPTAVLKEQSKQLIPPPVPASSNWNRAIAYLCGRGISYNLVRSLMNRGLLYQEAEYNNIVFFNPDNGHYEMNTSLSGQRFKRVINPGVWLFGKGRRAYVCEAAIDAMSLFEILKDYNAVYISLGGCGSRYHELEKVLSEYNEVIMAVDNDAAGDELCSRFSSLRRIRPTHKDFNEDLQYCSSHL